MKRTQRSFSVLLALTAALLVPQASAEVPSGSFEQVININGEERRYFLQVPPGLSPPLTYPVIFYFHGSSAERNEYRGDQSLHVRELKARALAEEIILVLPQGALVNDSSYGWQDDENSLVLFDELLISLKDRLPINVNRVYAAGFSSGGIASYRLACLRSSDVAAIISASANFNMRANSESSELYCPATDSPVSVRAYNGTDDLIPHDHVKNSVVKVWATELNGCSARSNDRVYVPYPGSTPWVITEWPRCSNNAAVQFVSMTGMPHSEIVPQAVGNAIEFLLEHPKKRKDPRAHGLAEEIGDSTGRTKKTATLADRVLTLAAPIWQTKYRTMYERFEKSVRRTEGAQRKLRQLEVTGTSGDSAEYEVIAREIRQTKKELLDITKTFDAAVKNDASETTVNFKLALRILTEHVETQSQTVQTITRG